MRKVFREATFCLEHAEIWKGMVINMEYRAHNYKEAEQYLNEVPRFTTKNPLEETRGFYQYLLSAESGTGLQETQLGIIIHVAGTNGKGSVCAYMDSICRESGYHTGLFTSPHLVTTRERFRIDGEMVSEEEFVEAFNWLAEQIDCYHKHRESYQPTYFERLFFMMLWLFAKAGVEVTVLETGLGGRLDTTNVVEHPSLTMITEIGMDHMAYLGDTLEKIAGEKAGIIKSGVPVVYFDKRKETSAVLWQKAAEVGAECFKVSKNAYKINGIQKKCIDFSVCSRYYGYIGLQAHTTAAYQAENGAMAVCGAELLKEKGALERINRESIIRGIYNMRWAGRMEEIRPNVYIDGAHNEDGIRAFIDSVALMHGQSPVVLLFSAVNDKRYDSMIEMLTGVDCIDQFCITQIPGSRGVRIEELTQQFAQRTDKPVHAFEDFRDAYDFCRRAKKDVGTLYIVGSLYLAGLAEDILQ